MTDETDAAQSKEDRVLAFFEHHIRQTVREEIERATNALADATCDVLASLLNPIGQRLAECEKSLGLMIDHSAFMEKALVRYTEVAHEPDTQADEDSEPWRESINMQDAIDDCEPHLSAQEHLRKELEEDSEPWRESLADDPPECSE